MPFRRNGGDIENRGLVFTERFVGLAFFVAFIGGIIGRASESFIVFFSFVGLGFLILVVGALLPKPDANPYKTKRFKRLLRNARDEFESGDYKCAKESIRRAKVHGVLPDDFQKMESDIVEKIT